MANDRNKDAQIVSSWRKNAGPWTEAVRSGAIESRKQATDAAIVHAVAARSPRSAVDVGCGEGWLSRALTERGIRMTGIDVVPELVDAARRAGGGTFHVMSYEAFAAGELDVTADAVVCNFSLIGESSAEAVLRGGRRVLAPDGAIVIQTLHPLARSSVGPYRDGWREGSWAGIGQAFSDPPPWYFRTVGSWIRLLRSNGFGIVDLLEPVGRAGEPLSAIFVAERAA